MIYINGENNVEIGDHKVALNIVECNEDIINFFDSNLQNLFDISDRYIKEDMKQRVFSKGKILPEDISEILVQLLLIEKGYKYVTYSYNIESPREKSKGFDGIFFKYNQMFYLEVKTKKKSDESSYVKDINKKIQAAYKDVHETKIKDKDDYRRLETYCKNHFTIKSSDFNLPLDTLISKVINDIDKETFNLLFCGAANVDENLKFKLENFDEISQTCATSSKIRNYHMIGLISSIEEDFNAKIKEKYEI